MPVVGPPILPPPPPPSPPSGGLLDLEPYGGMLDLGAPGQDGILATGNEEFPYLLYVCTVRWFWDTGDRVMAAAGPKGTPPRVVALHGGVGEKTITFNAIRQGAWPVVPNMDPTDPNNEKLINLTVVPTLPPPNADGRTAKYQIQGVYTYALLRQPTPAAGFRVGSLPTVNTGRAANDLTTLQFSDLIVS